MSENNLSQAQTEVNRWLQQGIAAVKVGERRQARDLLLRVVEQDENNVSAWLWLSAVVDSPEDQEVCLSNVLALDPSNQAAARGMIAVRKTLVDDYVRRAVASAKSGQRQQARELLSRVLEWDEDNVKAWALLGSVVETWEERETCLKQALSLDPDNEAIRKALARGQQQQQVTRGADAARELPQAPVPQQVAARQAAPELVAAPTPAAGVQESDPSPAPPGGELDLSDEYLCPYCAAPTQPEDRRCQSCGGSLWVQVARSSERSTALWGTFGIQFLNSLNFLALPLWTLFELVLQIKAITLAASIGQALDGELANPLESLLSFQNPVDLIPLYLGMQHDVAPDIAELAFKIMPRDTFILLILPVVFAVMTLVVLFIRMKPAYYFVIAAAVFDALFVLACFIIPPLNVVVPTPFRAIALVLALTRLVLVFQIEDDFLADDQRILLRPDRGVSDGVHFLQRGLYYARQKMWALAALHLREAIQLLPDHVDGQVALMLSYLKLGRPALAAEVLGVFEQNNPSDPRIAELSAAIRGELGSKAVPA